jgi:8-oxo-dGTP pyrophosphatase MutT (NUDIX family)
VVGEVSVTVAAVVERDGKFLFVEEETDEGVRLNQPAGRLESDESLLEGVVRETLEETAYRFIPEALVGAYQWRHPTRGITYLRFAFCGVARGPEPARALDQGILRALWLTPEELRSQPVPHRSPLVTRCIDDYLAGRRFPLDLVARCA